MSGRTWLILLSLLAVAGWWFSPQSPRAARVPQAIAGTTAGCRLPTGLRDEAEPLQSPVPSSLSPFLLKAATLTPLAGFSIDARVLSREDYSLGREADLSPTDLALGWGRMREDAVLDQLSISQSGRWYNYRWANQPPLPPYEIASSSANMHMIPADQATADALKDVRAGDRVRIDGWLVEAQAPDGWHWRSSTRRDDTGDGACEVIYVCSLSRATQ
ncbi:hypothetical protein [Montanilutibacter psychrotolerans]|uniref:Uncharacterized protein n=1 Tax=Montanilutibacter psychrotolerans TaxID=1327343 RepID=A0A3M8STN2_9GAMM|nr:hypothetical protein [Lysobacter psychrotolerans]RNF84153.1 hypothetical protein EER27_07035 [Lysobacter psychrotolerans]